MLAFLNKKKKDDIQGEQLLEKVDEIFQPNPNVYYKIITKLTESKCLEIVEKGAHNKLVITEDQQKNGQKFQIFKDQGKYVFINKLNGGILKVIPSSNAKMNENKAEFGCFERIHKAQERFQLVKVTDGEFKKRPTYFIVTYIGKAMDVEGGKTSDNTKVLQWNFHKGLNQVWQIVPTAQKLKNNMFMNSLYHNEQDQIRFKPIKQQHYRIMSALGKNMALTCYHADKKNQDLILSVYKQENNQKFTFEYDQQKNGFQIFNINYGMCLKVSDGSSQKGAYLCTSFANCTGQQYFRVKPTQTGPFKGRNSYKIKTFCKKALEVENQICKDGVKIIQCDLGDDMKTSQIWFILPC